MLKQLAWMTGLVGRKSADYLCGVPGKSRGKLAEIRLAYKAGAHGYRPRKKEGPENMEPEVREFVERNGWTQKELDRHIRSLI